MRSESLKKLVAAFLVVTVIASLGLTAFATTPVDGENSTGEGIVTAEIVITETGDEDLYNVDVNYTNNVESSIGVTMLAYTAKEGEEDIGSANLTTGYNSTDYDIVALDQTDETSTGTFSFIVDTNPDSENPDAIDMDKGEKGIILLSADGTTAPAAYMFSIAGDEFIITKVETNDDDGEITVPAGSTKEDVLAELEKLDIIVSGDDPSIFEDNWTATWELPDKFDAGTRYEIVGTLVKPDGSMGILADVTTIKIDVVVEAASAVEWTATKGTLAAIDVTIDAGGDVAAEVKTALVDKVITITDEAGTYSAQVVVTEAIANTATKVSGDASPYTYKVTVAADSAITSVPEGTNATITAGGFDVQFTVNVTENPSGGGEEPDPDEPTGETYLIGDVNGDKTIGPADWQQIIKHIKKDTPAGFIVEAADCDGDGSVGPADWQLIIKYIKKQPAKDVGQTKIK